MGRSASERFDAARDVYRRADEALASSSEGAQTADRISKLCFEGPIEALTLTANTQPALVATSAALVAAIRAMYPQLPPPVVALGHSLGEYSALVAAGALALEDAVRLCRARGEAMQAAVPAGEGRMAAIIGLDPDAIAKLCEDASSAGLVAPANFNAPGQIVIAGTRAGVERACELCSSRGAKAIPLNVSAPFHCALMKPAALALEAALRPIEARPLAFPVIANVDAEANTDHERVKDLLVRQVDAPVQWVRSMERASEMGITAALEIGPGKVLAGLAKRIDKRIRVINVGDADAIERLGEALSL
jgi:[acyl-carrier-protein] S-malonyltransferase